jgi:diguanylate cyclase (GGDEF)-like protein
MQIPDLPANESARLDALRALQLLDTPAEDRFDRLTRLACRVFGVSTALVSLVDADRQWFKSRVGMTLCETRREDSFCGHAILGDGVMVVPDTLEDQRFADNPLVLGEPHVRFYAGCVLQAPDGSKIGTLCVLDQHPRHFSADDKQALTDLGHLAERELVSTELALVDMLTQIPNRHGFEVLARQALGLCQRQDVPASLLYFDLNDFKAINDAHGHATGDHVLKSFALMLAETFRGSDVLGRVGGDEFAVLQVGGEESACAVTLTRLQAAADRFNVAADRAYRLAFSVGQAHSPALSDVDLDTLMGQADERMYEHKRQRRPAP